MKISISRTALVSGLFCTALLAGCADSPARETAGQYFDDATITAKVKSELIAKEGVSASNISVNTERGEVQLSGFAKSDAERQQAADIARAVSGVNRVHNDILVR